MYKSVIYVVNEIKGKTERLKTNNELNVVRDYRGDSKSFISVSLSQPDVPTLIVTNYHKFEMKHVEVSGGQRSFWTKDSDAIRIANNLYKRGITSVLKDFRGKTVTKVTISPDDNFYNKIDEFCGIDKTTSHFGYKDRNGRIVDGFKKADVVRHKISMNDYADLGINIYSIFKDKTVFEATLEKFTKNAELYGLDTTNPVDLLTFVWMNKHNHRDFIEEDRFKCPHCGNIVHINGHEEFIKGKPVNTGETICDYCGEEFDIHDKQDIIEFYYNTVFAE